LVQHFLLPDHVYLPFSHCGRVQLAILWALAFCLVPVPTLYVESPLRLNLVTQLLRRSEPIWGC
jgi:hypothetical protein